MPAEATRQQRRLHRLTKDPNGPHMRRLDLLLEEDKYRRFEEILACGKGSMRRRETIQAAIDVLYEMKVAAGEIEPQQA